MLKIPLVYQKHYDLEVSTDEKKYISNADRDNKVFNFHVLVKNMTFLITCAVPVCVVQARDRFGNTQPFNRLGKVIS